MRTRILWYTGKIKVGDIVTRKILRPIDQQIEDDVGKYGIVVGREMIGNPIHPCVIVAWSKGQSPTSLGESYVEVVCKKGNE